MITLTLRETGDRMRDVRRLRHVHGLLASYPGLDHFALHIYEGSVPGALSSQRNDGLQRRP
jgi:hypothetical protein